MLRRWQFNALVVLGVLSLALTAVNATLFTLNRDAQAELAQHQQYIQQSVALEGLYREMVKALAELGSHGGDRALLDMLAAQGLNVTVSGAAATTPAAGDAGARK